MFQLDQPPFYNWLNHPFSPLFQPETTMVSNLVPLSKNTVNVPFWHRVPCWPHLPLALRQRRSLPSTLPHLSLSLPLVYRFHPASQRHLSRCPGHSSKATYSFAFTPRTSSHSSVDSIEYPYTLRPGTRDQRWEQLLREASIPCNLRNFQWLRIRKNSKSSRPKQK